MDTKITFTVPSQTITKLRRLASTRNKPLDDVLVEAVETLDAMATAQNGQTKRREAMLKEERAFRKLHPTLLNQYAGEFVAIYQGEMVDHDPDQLVLLQRKRQKYPGQVVLIARLVAEPEEIYHFRSPRLEESDL